MNNLYSIDVRIYGTAYIVAGSEEEAQAIADALKDTHLELPTGYAGDDIEIEGGRFHADMPELSLSPAMTIYGPDAGDTVELVEEFEDAD